MLKKFFLTASAIVALSSTSNAQFDLGDTRSDVLTFLQSYYSGRYSTYYNNDIRLDYDSDIYVWKFDSQGRISHIYIWYHTSEKDNSERADLNGGKYYKAEDNKWKRYYGNGNVAEIVTYGSVNTTYGSGSYSFVKSGTWHYDYYY